MFSQQDLSTIFTLTSISTVLFLYEYILFVKVVVPSVSEQIDSKIKTLKQNTVGNDMIRFLHGIIQVFDKREQVLDKKINNYTFYTAILILVSLLTFLYYVKKSIVYMDPCVWYIIGATLFLIFSFQYIFYKYGKKYNYTGSEGEEELNDMLLQNIIE